MRPSSTRALLVSLLLSSIGCGSASLESNVASYLSAHNATVRDCGVIAVPLCMSDAVTPADQAKIKCLADCGTRLEVTEYTVEGALITTVFVRTLSSGLCTTAIFVDDGADSYSSAPGVHRSQCEISTTNPTCSAPVHAEKCGALP